jgi:hypothetical protein
MFKPVCREGLLLLLSQATAQNPTAYQPVSNLLLLNGKADSVQACLQGRTPENEETVALFHLLSQANVDLRQPVSLEQQLMEDNDMDADVGLAMVQLLKVRTFVCDLVLIALLCKAYPDGCQLRLQILLRLRSYPMRGHQLL